MDNKRITAAGDQKKIARFMIEEFGRRVKAVAADNPHRIFVVDTLNTLAPDEWLNEIHATSKGYREVADKILKVMSQFV